MKLHGVRLLNKTVLKFGSFQSSDIPGRRGGSHPPEVFYIFQDDKTSAPVVQKVDNAIHRINLYPLDSAIGFPNNYLLDSDVSSG